MADSEPRLFYFPRVRPDGPAYVCEFVEGNACPLRELGAVPDAAPLLAGMSGTARGGAGSSGPKTIADPDTGEVFDLKKWAVRCAPHFEIVKALQARAPGIFSPRVSGVKRHIYCPNSDKHITGGVEGTGTFCVNASDLPKAGLPEIKSGFVIKCSHNGCTGVDRLDHLRALLEGGSLSIDDLKNPDFLWDMPQAQSAPSKKTFSANQTDGKPKEENSINKTIRQVIEYFNKKYMVVNGNGKAVTFKMRHDETLNRRCIDRISVADLRAFYMNEKIVVHVDENGKETESTAANIWLNNPWRRQYLDGVIFNPNSAADIPGVLNLWNGFDTKPAPGDWALMREHILSVVCGGNQAYFDYLIKWIASMLQRPGQPSEVAVVLRSGEGTGKGVLANALRRIIGQHSVRVTNPEQIAGKFNAHLQDAIFLFGDEAFFAGNRAHAAFLRGLVTENTIRVELKGRDSFQVPSFLHIMLASNEEWVVPSAKDDRRYFVLDVAETRKGDRAYFNAIVNQMQSGGDAAMLHDLLAMDISDFEVRDFPKTAAAQEQKSLSLKTTDAWILDCLERGYIFQSEHGYGAELHKWMPVVTSRLLFSSYEKFAKNHGERHPLPRGLLFKFLNGMGFAYTRPNEARVVGESKYGLERENKMPSYDLGNLAAARAAFCAASGFAVEWEAGATEAPEAPCPAAGRGEGPAKVLPWKR